MYEICVECFVGGEYVECVYCVMGVGIVEFEEDW